MDGVAQIRPSVNSKKTGSHCPGGPWTAEDKDYVVFDAGQVNGRIMLHPQAPVGNPWSWTITARELIATDGRGYAATGEDAIADFNARWLTLGTTSAEHVPYR